MSGGFAWRERERERNSLEPTALRGTEPNNRSTLNSRPAVRRLAKTEALPQNWLLAAHHEEDNATLYLGVLATYRLFSRLEPPCQDRLRARKTGAALSRLSTLEALLAINNIC